MYEEIEDAYDHICKGATFRADSDYMIDDDGNEVIDTKDAPIEDVGVIGETVDDGAAEEEHEEEDDEQKVRQSSGLVQMRRKLDNELKTQEPFRHLVEFTYDDGKTYKLKVMAKSKTKKDTYIFLDLDIDKMSTYSLLRMKL